ncbi:MAG: NAD(P)H-dependent oxidoreductase [Alphaproteobacteria bacterium]|nr:NAD(P)H-dependent oxidoreductase [Alphaproteobacteria bacterium]MDE2340829.1 NAD(P)H-dependent oxidoreductase [Alphaproteobacteria bacterium]
MRKVLVLRAAATGAASVSNQLIDAWLATHPDIESVERNLDTHPVPHVTSSALAGIGRQAPEGRDFIATRALADSLIAEVFAADILLIGLPLYNFGIPSTLKSWFDYVLRAGTTFRYTAEGPEGLVNGKRVIVAHARGGKYDDAAGIALGLAHLKTLLGFMGITNVEVVTAEGLAFGPEIAQTALTQAREQIAALA